MWQHARWIVKEVESIHLNANCQGDRRCGGRLVVGHVGGHHVGWQSGRPPRRLTEEEMTEHVLPRGHHTQTHHHLYQKHA